MIKVRRIFYSLSIKILCILNKCLCSTCQHISMSVKAFAYYKLGADILKEQM